MVAVINDPNSDNTIHDFDDINAVEEAEDLPGVVDQADPQLDAIQTLIENVSKFIKYISELDDEVIAVHFTAPCVTVGVKVGKKIARKITKNNDDYGVDYQFINRLLMYAAIIVALEISSYFFDIFFIVNIITSLPITIIMILCQMRMMLLQFTMKPGEDRVVKMLYIIRNTSIQICDLFYFWFLIFEYLLMKIVTLKRMCW